MNDSISRLYASVVSARDRDPSLSRTSKLFHDGVQKMAKKLAEDAIEVGFDAIQMKRSAVILESVDLLHHLAVIWATCGLDPSDIDAEIERRERIYGIAEKLPKNDRSHSALQKKSARKSARRAARTPRPPCPDNVSDVIVNFTSSRLSSYGRKFHR